MKKPKLPRKASPGVAAFLSLVDEVRVADIPTSATALNADGTLELLLGQMYEEGDEHTRAEMLKHEATHFYLSHLTRYPGERGDQREMMIWNLVTDAAMHYLGGCHCEDPNSVTWDSLGLSPMSPEMAFDLLKEQLQECTSGGCGSLSHGLSEMGTGAKMKQLEAAAVMGRHDEFKDMLVGLRGGMGSGNGAYLELKPPPPWIRQTFDYLLSTVSDERRRSWRRENRMSTMLPGRSHQYGRGALFLIDSSASISNGTLQQFLSAVQATPELAGSTCAFFDSEVSARVPVAKAQQTLASHGRGGTDFLPPAGLRQPGEAVVWLTDGYPCGSWPDPHAGPEVWCITTNVRPPHGVLIQIDA